MYVPQAFQESNQARLFDFIERYSFGLLVSHHEGEPFATHLPMLLDVAGGANAQLLGHLARANPQWQAMSGQDVLAVFTGPHAYISPAWYESDNVVPTWNYVAVHVYGKCQVLDDERATARILQQYVTNYERGMPVPWTIDSGTPFFEKMVKMVVGFRIDIERIEGKWKLNQNHPIERREKVVRHLAGKEDVNAQEIARLMADTLPKD